MVSFNTARGPRGNRPKANNQGGTPTAELSTLRNAQRTNARWLCHDLGFSAATLLIMFFSVPINLLQSPVCSGLPGTL